MSAPAIDQSVRNEVQAERKREEALLGAPVIVIGSVQPVIPPPEPISCSRRPEPKPKVIDRAAERHARRRRQK